MNQFVNENIDLQPERQPEQQNNPPSKTPRWVAWVLVAAAVIALVCGYLGAYLANEQAGRVVIQKVETTSSDSADGDGTSAVEVVAAISPTVVSITTEKMEVSQFWFGTQIASGAGSGVIISEDGYILTCAHVISGADNILVTTSDGTEYPATVVGSYEDGDIAVLKIEAEGLQAAVLGDSDTVQTGETVYAVGNPGGTLSGTVTDGIISATNRTISVTIESESGNSTYPISTERTISLEVLQTSAAVSPGNSGGGLFNSRGELIGIVNAKSSGESQEGLGFAIPINTAQEIATALINDGVYIDPDAADSGNSAVLNIVVAEVSPAMSQATGQTAGVYVQEVTAGGASDGLLEAGDRIISMNGTVVNTTEDLSALLAECAPGDTASLTVDRDGQMVTVDVTLAEN